MCRAGFALFFLSLTLLFACLAHEAHAQTWRVSFMTRSYALHEEGVRMDVGIWYPTASRRRASTIRLQDWSFRCLNNAPLPPGPFPLVVVSHPSSGMRFTAFNTAMDLAAAGYIVVALTHPSDNVDNMPYMLSWEQFSSRCHDASRLLDLILADKQLGPAINAGRIGVLGFEAGATTGLLLGGALLRCDAWADFCEDTSSTHDVYCNRWARNRITRSLCSKLPQHENLADERVSAVAAVAPTLSMLMTKEALQNFYPALLLVTPDKAPDEIKSGYAGLDKRFPGPVEHYRFPAGDVWALMAECPEQMRDNLLDMCLSADSRMRRELHVQFMAVLIRFFDNILVRGAPGRIAEPPQPASSGKLDSTAARP